MILKAIISSLASHIDEAPDWVKALIVLLACINLALYALELLLKAIIYVLKNT